MRKIKIFLFFLILTFLAVIFLLGKNLADFYWRKFLNLPEIKIKLTNFTKEIETKISTPPPLIRENEVKDGFLTKEGVIEWTNKERIKYGLVPLKESEKLNQSAQLKANDMFQFQYFSHDSPSGKTLNYWINNVSYQFIAIGENLALGNFKDDNALVLAWMESPGHRANILNKDYQEIGVAVLKGFFQGKEVWIAVQHFGLPLSFCPQPEKDLKAAIEKKQVEISELKIKLDSLEREIKTIRPKRLFFYQQEKIEEYNRLVNQYNFLIKEVENLIKDYNNQVDLFNQCLSKFQ